MSQLSSRNGDSDLQDQDRSPDRAEEAAIAGAAGLADLDQLGQGIGVAQFLRSIGMGDLLTEGAEAPATEEQARPPSVDAPSRRSSTSPHRSPTAPPSSAGHEEDASAPPPLRRSLSEIDEDYDDDDDDPPATARPADPPAQPSPDVTQAPATGTQGATAAAKKGKKTGRKARAGPSRKSARGVKKAQKGTGNGVEKRARRVAARDRVRVEGTRRSRRKAGLAPEFGGI
ncbi:hypothetical protein LTR04_004106 [Oleoguttula sp. CCFEE 6159]|nr:hypothetical protein LTR04_004106 [Oleoguttula sp. CCFEE 6159]